MAIAPIEAAIEDIRQGKMIILTDDEDRENEGDLTMAAELVTLRPSTSWPASAGASSAWPWSRRW